MVGRRAVPRAHRMSHRLRRATVAVLAMGAFGGAVRRAYSHPLHTTLSEVTIASDGGVQIVLRAFVDDFSAAVAGRAGALPPPIATPPDSATARYLANAIALTDAKGRGVALGLAGVRRDGNLLWVTLRAPASAGRAVARLTNHVLFERYDDQVNIVQTSIAGRRQTLLFTNRDGAAAKPI